MITTKAELENIVTLTDSEKAWFDDPSSLPLLISDHLAGLMCHEGIRRQFVPSLEEKDEAESLDPLAEVEHSVSSRLIHRYGHRVALLTTVRCFSYCRHCFRRRFTGLDSGPISDSEIERAADYLEHHGEVYEVLLTGGDMFTLSDDRLERLLSALRRKRSDLVLRLCTRAPVSYPERFSDELMAIMEKHNEEGPMVLMCQFNHPDELSAESLDAVRKFTRLGIPAFNQSVLLRGVNDDADTLERLCVALLRNRIKPYYLFQCDLVRGTAHFRVSVDRGLEIEAELRRRLSGLAMPQYTIDLPEGGGKVILTENHLIGREDGQLIFTTVDGQERRYPEK